MTTVFFLVFLEGGEGRIEGEVWWWAKGRKSTRGVSTCQQKISASAKRVSKN
jgi:hypothetical protein